MTKLAGRRNLHAAHFDNLPDQSSVHGFRPQELALDVCEASTYRTLVRCDIAQPAAVFALTLGESSDCDVVRFCRFDFDPVLALTKHQSFVAQLVGALELSVNVVGPGIGEITPT